METPLKLCPIDLTHSTCLCYYGRQFCPWIHSHWNRLNFLIFSFLSFTLFTSKWSSLASAKCKELTGSFLQRPFYFRSGPEAALKQHVAPGKAKGVPYLREPASVSNKACLFHLKPVLLCSSFSFGLILSIDYNSTQGENKHLIKSLLIPFMLELSLWGVRGAVVKSLR